MVNNEKKETDTITTERPVTPNTSKKKRNIIIVIIAIFVIAAGISSTLLLKKEKAEKKTTNVNEENVEIYRTYQLSGNSLEDFDLSFLQLENEKKNKVYSPLSIKYALAMLLEGTDGQTKEQISNTIGNYQFKKYTNSKNISLANALFIKDTNKDTIKETYINNLLSKYNAEVIYDSFTTPNSLNSWVSNKTLNLINNLFNDISNQEFILVNTLAIDMEWINKIQNEDTDYIKKYAHQDFNFNVHALGLADYYALPFKDVSYDVKSAEIGAVINKYDIVNTLGEDSIRKTVGDEYTKWLNEGAPDSCNDFKDEPDVNTYLNQYIKEISEGYKDISSSTDFTFYVDDSVKVFAKDLKEYDGTTLQYIGIMPTTDSLDNYIKNVKVEDINYLINSLKSIELGNFKEGVITTITGYIPMFEFDYELDLIANLKRLGITNIFDSNKADLSNLSSNKIFIDQVSHKTNIAFSNNGIKASSAVTLGGAGSAGCGFDYIYEVPVETIDLTFDKPYLFIIKDKDSGEVWFVGTVYEPIKFEPSEDGI